MQLHRKIISATSKRLYILVVLLLILAINATGQERSITLNEAIELALTNNIDIRKNQNNLERAKNTSSTSYLDLLPKAEIFSNAYRATGNTFDEITGASQSTSGRYVNANITVSWDILNVLSKHSNLKYGKNNQAFSMWNVESVKDETALMVVQTYLEILQNYEQDDILQEFLNTQQSNLEQIDEMISLGSLAGQDHYLQKTELSRLFSAKTENANRINTKINDLLLLLGVEVNTKIKLEPTLLALEEFRTLSTINIDSLFLDAKNLRSDLKSREFQLASMKDQINIEKSNFHPSIDVFYRYGSGYSSFLERDFDDQFFDDNINKTYGVQMIIPVFNGNKTRNSVYKSKISYQNAQLDLQQFTNSIYTQISNFQGNISRSLEELTYRENQEESSSLNYELVREKYFLQAASAQELATAYRDYIEAELLLSQSKYQLIFDYYQMQYGLGTLRTMFK